MGKLEATSGIIKNDLLLQSSLVVKRISRVVASEITQNQEVFEAIWKHLGIFILMAAEKPVKREKLVV